MLLDHRAKTIATRTIYDLMDRRCIDVPGRKRENFPDITDERFWELYDRCAPYSMAHITGFLNAYQAVRHVAGSRLRGDIVECGCLLGGMSMFLAVLCERFELNDARVIVFDTFEGFLDDQEDALVGATEAIRGHSYPSIRAEVEHNLARLVAHPDRVRFVEGKVEDTLPDFPSRDIAILRLDTDFYSSTKAELDYLYPHLVSGGVLIVDDYGTYQGARRATDAYLASLQSPPLLNRIDMSVWSGVKP